MPAQLKPGENVSGTRINLHPSIRERLRVLAFAERTTISEQVRRAVEAYLTRRRKRGGEKAS